MNDALLCSIMYACDGVRGDGCVKLYIACCRDRKEKSWNHPMFPLKSVAKLLKIYIIVCCITV